MLALFRLDEGITQTKTIVEKISAEGGSELALATFFSTSVTLNGLLLVLIADVSGIYLIRNWI